MKPFAYARPKAVTEALELARGGATVMAGGTDLLGLMKDGIAAPERIVDIRDLEPLRGDGDALALLGVAVPRDVLALVDHEALLAGIGHEPGVGGAPQAGAHDQIVIHQATQ